MRVNWPKPNFDELFDDDTGRDNAATKKQEEQPDTEGWLPFAVHPEPGEERTTADPSVKVPIDWANRLKALGLAERVAEVNVESLQGHSVPSPAEAQADPIPEMKSESFMVAESTMEAALDLLKDAKETLHRRSSVPSEHEPKQGIQRSDSEETIVVSDSSETEELDPKDSIIPDTPASGKLDIPALHIRFAPSDCNPHRLSNGWTTLKRALHIRARGRGRGRGQ